MHADRQDCRSRRRAAFSGFVFFLLPGRNHTYLVVATAGSVKTRAQVTQTIGRWNIIMIHADNFEPLNIFGRYTYALVCIERLCQNWDVTDSFVLALLDAHWALMEINTSYDKWLEETSTYANLSPERLASQLEKTPLSSNQIQSLYHAIYELRELVDTDMYCQPESFRSMRHLMNVVNILLHWNIQPPSLESFAKATYLPGKFGYYGPYKRQDFFI